MTILLLVAAVFCLGWWANLFRWSGRSWRFELFSIDFAIGAALSSCLIASFFGMFGSELSVIDRLAVAGLRSQAYVLTAGLLFSIGNTLLLGAISLLGIARAFVLVFSAACLVVAISELARGGSGSTLLFGASAMAALVASILGVRQSEKKPQQTLLRQPLLGRSTKAIILGSIAGIFIGLSYPLAALGFWGELGLHSDAGLLLFSLGLFVAALPFSVYLMNVAIEGGRLRLRAYRVGSRRHHGLGLAGGLVWACGTFAALLAKDLRDGGSEANFSFVPLVTFLLPALLAMASGWLFWQDERPLLRKSAVCFAAVWCLLLVAAFFAYRSA